MHTHTLTHTPTHSLRVQPTHINHAHHKVLAFSVTYCTNHRRPRVNADITFPSLPPPNHTSAYRYGSPYILYTFAQCHTDTHLDRYLYYLLMHIPIQRTVPPVPVLLNTFLRCRPSLKGMQQVRGLGLQQSIARV